MSSLNNEQNIIGAEKNFMCDFSPFSNGHLILSHLSLAWESFCLNAQLPYQTTRCHIPESSIFQCVCEEEVHKLNEIIN